MNFKEQLHDIAGVKSHTMFERYLYDIIFKPEERERFYWGLHEVNPSLSTDTFKPYFEEHSAERQTNQQLYTPDEVAELLSLMIGDGFSAYDPAAGTGTLLIDKWNHDRIQQSPFTYYPHNYFYIAEELADNSLPYLIHNMAYRGMNGIVMHGDSVERVYENIFYIQNTNDDFMDFSDVNVLPRTKDTEEYLDINGWTGKAIEHIESNGFYIQEENEAYEMIERVLRQ